jgi:hypothetical protein
VGGVIQPNPDSAQAGEVETEHILAPADGPRRTVTFPLPRVHREAVAVGGDGPSCDRLSGSRNEPALTRELPPVEVAKALDLGKADIFEQTSELGRGIDGLVRSTNAWKSNLSRCRFRQTAVTETSVHNAVQPLTHARGTCSGKRSGVN